MPSQNLHQDQAAPPLELLRATLRDPEASFRDGQWEAVTAMVERKARLLLVQRTGWGKSIVYFLATRLLRDRGDGPTLLISPLLSLIRNQISAASALGIRAASINSENRDHWDEIAGQLRNDQADLLLVAPERLANQRFRKEFLAPAMARIGLFVIDEAHCVSDWGHDFRPDYRRIGSLIELLPHDIPLLATTATANDRVVEDIIEQFGSNLELMRGPLRRNSLILQNIIMPGASERLAWLAHYVPQFPGSGIIYALTKHDAEIIAAWLQSRGISAEAYHSEIGREIPGLREDLERKLLNNEVKALVATTALGMGFDKPDIRFVVHYQRPASVVHYYQQVGRAGRNGKGSYCILLCGAEDDEIGDYFIVSALPRNEDVGRILKALEGFCGY